MAKSKLTFEEKLQKLKDINDKLSTGHLGLKDNLALFKEGKKLKNTATKDLANAKTEFAKIEKDDGTQAPFSRDKNGQDNQDSISNNQPSGNYGPSYNNENKDDEKSDKNPFEVNFNK